MKTQEPKANLASAIIKVMKDVKGIEKNSTVGSGSYSYKGVNDQDVKKIVGQAMTEAGLCIIPVDVEATTNIDRWTETYNGNEKQKQLVFSEVKTKYLLLHESGESIEVCGYGHGTDTLDKAAGKATTYALKYALLYSFLIPTGDIDDTDTTHSDDVKKPSSNTKTTAPKRNENGSINGQEKAWLNQKDNEGNFTKQWVNVLNGIDTGKIKDLKDVLSVYRISKALQDEIKEIIENKTIKAA